MYIIQLFIFVWMLLSGESVLALFGFGGGASGGGEGEGAEMVFEDGEYGVDCSYPIHHKLNTKSPYPVKAMWAEKYAKMMQGCYDAFSFRECDSNERARIEMNFDQPRSQHNYTEIGFKKMRAPQSAWEPLIAFWNQHKTQERAEGWPRGNTYVNNWEVASYMVSLEDKTLEGGLNVKQQVWDAVRPVLEEWTGKELSPTSLYGIRIYKEGAVLASHVDRLPLVSSAIIQIAQDLDEPWPIEVYSHAGKAYNVTMEPGDMVKHISHRFNIYRQHTHTHTCTHTHTHTHTHTYTHTHTHIHTGALRVSHGATRTALSSRRQIIRKRLCALYSSGS